VPPCEPLPPTAGNPRNRAGSPPSRRSHRRRRQRTIQLPANLGELPILRRHKPLPLQHQRQVTLVRNRRLAPMPHPSPPQTTLF
jgi:hypothetical protein